MSEANESLVMRWARWQVRALARVWPAESRDWGEAIASEGEEIEQPIEAVGWALGGATVYLRALGTQLFEWLKMPVGQRGEATAGAPGPKRSRLFAVVTLTCAAVLLCLPEGREAIRTVVSSWEYYAEIDASQAELARLAEQAEKKNDAQLMAFAALGLEDGKRATGLADLAVKTEPRLFWIYEARRFWQNDMTAQTWTEKAQAADPQNAVPYLRAADAIANKIYFGMAERRTPTDPEVMQALSGNAEWMRLMDKAFRAPRYDSHYREHEELNREVWRREPQLTMTTILPGLSAHAIPYLNSLDRFTKLQVQQAEAELAAGHVEKAQELLSEAETFDKGMEGDSARYVWFFNPALSLERETALGWKAFYEQTGQPAKAQQAAQRVMQIKQRGTDAMREAQERWTKQNRGESNAWVVQLSAILMVVAVLATLGAVGAFEAWPGMRRRFGVTASVLSRAADFAPGMVLLASAVLVFSFLPYARAAAAFREGPAATFDQMRQLRMAYASLQAVTWRLAGPESSVFGWTVLTVVLSLAVALILARMVYRAMRKPAPQG